MRFPANGSEPWQVRVVANKFAALSLDIQPTRTVHRSRRSMGAFGVHDVIIDTPARSHSIAQMSDAQVANVLRVDKSRYDALSLDHRIAHVTIFNNHGADAGASLEQPHSQLIATPVISHPVRERFQQALNHHDEYGECMCQSLEEEIADRQRVLLLTEHFVALELYASPTPFPTPIYPRRHMASFGDISAAEIADLARVLRTVLAKL
jgi:UDPglucose--hexose-1-phosphate uridylyltransferase